MKTLIESKPLVSIIILSLLRKKHTENCISSILKHTIIPFEIIIVDMGQSEEIILWLKSEFGNRENFRIIFNTENVGTSKGRNHGVKVSNGKYVLFLDNDIIVSKNWLEPLVEIAGSHPRIAACGSLILSPSGKILVSPFTLKTYYTEDKISRIGLQCLEIPNMNHPLVCTTAQVAWYPTGCLLVCKAVFDELGGFDENYSLCEEDKDLSLSVQKLGYEIMYVPDSKVYHIEKNDEGNHEDYKKFRFDLKKIFNDKRYFENKWQSKVFIELSWTYLQKIGLTDQEIQKKRRFDFTTTITDDRHQSK